MTDDCHFDQRDDRMAAPWHPAIAALVHPCTADAGGTSPWMDEVDCAGSWQSRATQGAVAEKSGFVSAFQ